jgi:hypothetical protein
MSTFEDNMEEILDIDMTKANAIINPEEIVSGDATDDYSYTRAQLYSLIEKGQEAVMGALEVAQESGHPRAYEVAVNAMKQVSDMSDKLIDLQQKMKNLKKEDKKAGPTTVNNTMFVGTTADLQKMIKRGKVEEE